MSSSPYWHIGQRGETLAIPNLMAQRAMGNALEHSGAMHPYTKIALINYQKIKKKKEILGYQIWVSIVYPCSFSWGTGVCGSRDRGIMV